MDELLKFIVSILIFEENVVYYIRYLIMINKNFKKKL